MSALLSLEALVAEVRLLRLNAEAPCIGLANGCFDLLHPGHVAFIAEAAHHCDRLIVAIDDDERVRAAKGDSRPLRPLAERAVLIAALGDVWAVVAIDDEQKLPAILREVRPDVYIHRAEPAAPEALIAEAALGIKTVALGRHGGWSTSEEIERLMSVANAAHAHRRAVPRRRN